MHRGPQISQFFGESPYLIICAQFFTRRFRTPPPLRKGGRGVTWSSFPTCSSRSWEARRVSEGVGLGVPAYPSLTRRASKITRFALAPKLAHADNQPNTPHSPAFLH